MKVKQEVTLELRGPCIKLDEGSILVYVESKYRSVLPKVSELQRAVTTTYYRGNVRLRTLLYRFKWTASEVGLFLYHMKGQSC